MTHELEVRLEFPAVYNNFFGLKCSNLSDQERIDDSLVMMRARSRGSVFYKHMIIARDQVNVPLTFNAKVLINYFALGLTPGIKNFYPKISGCSQMPEQWRVVLNRVG